MYITPQSNIKLIANCPCDPDYTNTLHWYDRASQTAYFSSIAKYSLNGYSYQRYGKNKLRVGILADNIYDVNYMMFQNTAYGNKWFYAFVTEVEWLNNTTTEITYEIDEMQTWYLDYTLGQCFVERQHSTSDEIGDNILPEDVDIGELVYNYYADISSYDSALNLTNLAVIVAIMDVDGDSQHIADGSTYEHIYNGAKLFAFLATDSSGINDKINEYKDKPDSIISMYTVPRSAIAFPISSAGTEITSGVSEQAPWDITLPVLSSVNTLDGYTPKNKKLYTYPYNFLNIDNGRGETLALRYEFFSTPSNPKVTLYFNVVAPATVLLQPKGYKGLDSTAKLHTESLTLDNYPMCCWSYDAYQAWLAQNVTPMLIGVGGAYAGTVGALLGATVPPVGIVAGLMAVGNVLTKGYKASIQADVSKGVFNSGNVNVANNLHTFFVGRMSVNAQYAEMIDNFFTRFGYAQKKVMTPIRDARARWTYIKTIGCTIRGSLPADSEKKIQSIFDNGITFWIYPADVGNYSLDNSPSVG